LLTLYQIGIRIYYLMILAASPFSGRARAWIQGRRETRPILDAYVPDPERMTLWMHVSSLGEFEQGRPVLEKWKELNPNGRILLSFYSPSGYNIRKNYPLADLVFYLPYDTRRRMDSLVRRLRPDLFMLVKYDFWPVMLQTLNKYSVPCYLISARIREEQLLLRPAGRFILNELRKFVHLFVQDQASRDLLESRGLHNVTIAGDTRVDAVMGPRNQRDSSGVNPPVKKKPVIILGSSWPVEEEMMAAVWNSEEFAGYRKEWKLIIAPHDISPEHVKKIRELFGGGIVRYSEVLEGWVEKEEDLVVDTIGQLKGLYAYADVAFIGGGFGKGLHNILEPSAWGVPVLFGPNYQKFMEAVELIRIRSAVCVRSKSELSDALKKLFSDANERQQRGNLALSYMRNQEGSSDLIIRLLMEKNSTNSVNKWILTGQTVGNQ
jgi:3-deoxy-D-manno-octulosonic-acid transferase